jgi:hypothetical protein
MNPAGLLDCCWSDAAGTGLSRYNLASGEEGNFLRNFPLQSADGTVDGFVKVCRDLTERKQAEAALQREHDLLEVNARLSLASRTPHCKRKSLSAFGLSRPAPC